MNNKFRLSTAHAFLIMMTIAGISPANIDSEATSQVPQAAHRPVVELSLPEGPPPTVAVSRPEVVVDGVDWQRDLTLWAVDRFQEAGFALPDVNVSFGTLDYCGGNIGLATTGNSTAEVRICRRGGARKVLLHELAHVWAHQLPDTVKQSFVELTGTTSWNTEGEWHQHGSEHAAEIMAWALLEGNMAPHTSSFPGFESVNNEEAFQLLTGRAIPNWDGDITTPWDATAQQSPQPGRAGPHSEVVTAVGPSQLASQYPAMELNLLTVR